MSFGPLINNQVVTAVGDAFGLEIKINKLKDKIIDTIADKIEEQIPIPLPFNVRSILKDIARGNIPNIASLASPAAMKQVIEDNLPPIPEVVKQPIRDTLDQIDDSLKPIIETKNAVISAMLPLEKPIDTLKKITTTINSIIDPTKIVISVLKAMPVPTAIGVPPVALTAGQINTFGTLISKADKTIAVVGGPLSVINPSISQIKGTIDSILLPLQLVGDMVDKVTSITSFIRIYLGDPVVDKDGNPILGSNGKPLLSGDEGYAEAIFAVESLKISDISEDLPGPISSDSDPVVNKAANKALEASLQPGANPPYIYRGYKCIIQQNPGDPIYNEKNVFISFKPFSLPSRRIQGTFIKNAGNVYNVDEELQSKFNIDARLAEILKGDIIYNIPSTDLVTKIMSEASGSINNDIRITGINDHPYSFAVSTQVLVSEIQQQIDLRISGRVSTINRQNTRIVYDSAGVEVGIIPTLDSQILSIRDQKAIDYVMGFENGVVFDSYKELTTSRSFVYVNGNLLYSTKSKVGGVVQVTEVPLKMVKAGQIPGEYGTVLDIDDQYLSFNGIRDYIENPSRMKSYPPNVRSSGTLLDSFIFQYSPTETLDGVGGRSVFELTESKLQTGPTKGSKLYTFPPFGSPGTSKEIRRFQPTKSSNKSKTPTDNYSLWYFDISYINPSVLAKFSNTFIPGIWKPIYENYPSGNNFEFWKLNTFPFDSPGIINGEYRVKLQGSSKNTYRWFDNKLEWILQSSVLV